MLAMSHLDQKRRKKNMQHLNLHNMAYAQTSVGNTFLSDVGGSNQEKSRHQIFACNICFCEMFTFINCYFTFKELMFSKVFGSNFFQYSKIF